MEGRPEWGQSRTTRVARLAIPQCQPCEHCAEAKTRKHERMYINVLFMEGINRCMGKMFASLLEFCIADQDTAFFRTRAKHD